MTERNSLEKVLALLDVFTEDRLEWTPEELMAELGYSRPTLYRYIKTLKEAGFLTSMPNGSFTLGPRVVEMDFLMRKSDSLVRHAQGHLEALAREQPCSSLLVRWYGNKLLCVASECSTPDPLSSYPRGRPMPLARGAISRAIMAFMPRRKLVGIVEANLGELAAVGLGENVEQVLTSLRQVRRNGYAVAHGEVTPGVVGIAAPVFDGGSSPIAVLCVTIAEETVSSSRITEIGAKIRKAADEISHQLALERDQYGGEPRRTA